MLKRVVRTPVDSESPFEGDLFEREPVAQNLTRLLKTMDGPAVVAIDAPWGQGKTWFLDRWAKHLEGEGHPVVVFNAWESDFTEDPLLAFMSALDDQLPDTEEGAKKALVTLGSGIARRVVPRLVEAATAGLLREEDTTALRELLQDAERKELDNWTGEVARERLAAFQIGAETLRRFKAKLKALGEELVTEDVAQLPLVMLVDELDRCRPTFAVELLEQIKHLFDVEGIVFVVAVNREQLGHSICSLYGAEFDSIGYQARFIDLSYTLPEPDLYDFARHLLEEWDQGWWPDDLNPDTFARGLAVLGDHYGMSLRVFQQLVAELEIMLAVAPDHIRKHLSPTIALLLAMRRYEPRKVKEYVVGQTPVPDAQPVSGEFRATQFGALAVGGLFVCSADRKSARDQLHQVGTKDQIWQEIRRCASNMESRLRGQSSGAELRSVLDLSGKLSFPRIEAMQAQLEAGSVDLTGDDVNLTGPNDG